MARRPVFLPTPDSPGMVKAVTLELEWSAGFATGQKKKNVHALHAAAAAKGYAPLLEISTKSDEKLGRHLSAFHLKVVSIHGVLSLESAFQGSKVFERGGPHVDLYSREAREAKQDLRLRSSGTIVAFEFDGIRFPSEPKTAFYDWLYLRAIFEHREWLKSRLGKYAGFTDIEFNPERSINCQARSCALFVTLQAMGRLEEAMQSPDSFLRTIQKSAPHE